MKTKPVDNTITFTNRRIFERTMRTTYGKRITGSNGDKSYDVYVEQVGKNVFYKLYMVFKDNQWVKSVLKYFSNNKLYKEIRSKNKDD